jgi:hypothetical protein
MFFLALAWMMAFVFYFLPIIYPLFLEGRLWAVWLVAGMFGGPLALLIAYFSMKATDFQFRQWKAAVFVTILCFLYLTALASIFSNILPSYFEPFRSITLPIVILALTFVIFARTKYARRFQKYQPCS